MLRNFILLVIFKMQSSLRLFIVVLFKGMSIIKLQIVSVGYAKKNVNDTT